MSLFEREEPQYSRDETRERGHRAARLLADDLFREACETAEWDAIRGWRESNDPNARGRLLGVDDVRARLRAMVDDRDMLDSGRR